MKRTYINNEFKRQLVSGTFNMKEQKSFFGSKLMSIENGISILDNNIVWYQDLSNEQLDAQKELLNLPNIIILSDVKNDTSQLLFDDKQAVYDKDNNTKWLLKIDKNSIITQYCFGKIKEARSFEGVLNAETSKNNVDSAINDYVIQNIIDRYTFSKIELFIQYNNLNNKDTLRYNNTWDKNIAVADNKENNIFLVNDVELTVKFTQKQNSKHFNFNYYYNIYFNRI